MVDWFKFYWLKLKLVFRSKKMAREDVNSVSEVDADAMANLSAGAGLPHEEKVASEYYALGKVAFSKWFNLLVPLLAFLVVAMVWQALRGTIDWRHDYYALVNAAGLALVLGAIIWLSWEKPVTQVTEDEYKKAKAWLHYMGEEDHAPMGFAKKLIIALGLGLEAWAIGVVIAAAATSGQISEKFAGIAGLGIGAGIAVLMAVLSHLAGSQLYRARMRRIVKETVSRQRKKNAGESELLEKLQALDPQFESKFLGEITFLQKAGLLIVALLVSVLIGGFAFYERYNLNWETVFVEEGGAGEMIVAPPDMVPAAVAQQQQQADMSLDKQAREHEMNSIVAALAILFLLLLGMNALGILFGYQHSLVRESKKSWKNVQAYERLKLKGAKRLAEELAGWAMVIADANQWFGKYHNLLIAKAVEQGQTGLKTALNKRKAYRMERYIKEREGNGGAEKVDQGGVA